VVTEAIERDGFAAVEAVLSPSSVDALTAAVAAVASPEHACRNLFERVPAVRDRPGTARGDRPEAICTVGRGGAVVMRPRLLHASSPVKTASHRRVIHLEFAAGPLPPPLEWYQRVSVTA